MRVKQRSNLTNVSKTVTPRRPRPQGPEDDVIPAHKASASSKRTPSPERANQAPGDGGSGEGGQEDEEESEAGSSLNLAPDPDPSLQPGSDDPARYADPFTQSKRSFSTETLKMIKLLQSISLPI